jgi:hypothetical protein
MAWQTSMPAGIASQSGFERANTNRSSSYQKVGWSKVPPDAAKSRLKLEGPGDSRAAALAEPGLDPAPGI